MDDKGLELFAEELHEQLDLSVVPLGTWNCATTISSASCPLGTAATGTSASSQG